MPDTKNVSDFANADIEELEHMVKPTGFFRAKAAHIKEAAMMIMTEHGGKVPDNIDDLTKASGCRQKNCKCYSDSHLQRAGNRS